MANQRGSQQIFKAQVIADAPGTTSAVIGLGSLSNLVVMLRETAGNAVTVTVEVAGNVLSAGRNTIPTDDAHWFPLYDRSGAGVLYSIPVAANAAFAIDLSPFAAAYARLRASNTASGQVGTVDAWAELNG